MDLYFAGSIKGGRDDVDLYADLIAAMEQHGTVLTEHVGDDDITDQGEDDQTDEEIYQQDTTWLAQADAMVAEVTTPSLGVGYEISLAEAQQTPILCLYREEGDHALSSMIAGNPHLTVVRYSDIEEAETAIERFLSDLG